VHSAFSDAAAALVLAIASVIRSSAGCTAPAPPVAAPVATATADPASLPSPWASAVPSMARVTMTRFMACEDV
jgi:hypothetical protein